MINWNDIIKVTNHGNPSPPNRVEKSESEWKSLLSEEEFNITRLKGTERANRSDMCTAFDSGEYSCRCCNTALFDSSVKFNSGSGWPSFTQPIIENHVAYTKDSSYGMIRIEATCNVCDAHLGHVFPDGPEPSGLRFCINALSLKKS